MAAIPILLVAFRGLAGLLIVVLQGKISGGFIAGLIVLAVVSDIFDGILARRLGTDTPGLRRSDSMVDLLFWICVAIACWRGYRAEILRHAALLGVLVALEGVRVIFDFLKFRTYAAYHTYFSKGWALLLMVATVALLGFGVGGWFLTAALLFGIACELEGLFISLLLPGTRVDVISPWHAWRMRTEEIAPPQRAVETGRIGEPPA